MEASPSLPLHVPMPRPARGASTRVQVGSNDAILEAVRGGLAFVWTNGRSAQRFVLGLPPHGQLAMRLRAPRHALRVVPRESLTLAPGGRLAGYVQVSLVPTLVWQERGGREHVLVELLPDDQAAEWDAERGHSLLAESPWFVRFPMRSGEPRAVVAVRLRHRGSDAVQPAHLELRLRDGELRALRGSIVAAPRRFDAHGREMPAPRCEAQPSGAGA